MYMTMKTCTIRYMTVKSKTIFKIKVYYMTNGRVQSLVNMTAII